MPRIVSVPRTLAAVVRAHFGLSQTELARFLGVSRTQVSAVEIGRKEFSDAPLYRLWVLARAMPPPHGQGPAAPVFATGGPADAPDAPAPDLPAAPDQVQLHARLRRCRFLALRLRFELGQLHRPNQTHARRRWAVGVLRDALTPPGPDAPPPAPLTYPGATPDPARDLPWLTSLTQAVEFAPAPLTATGRALRLARLRGLEAEAAALEALITS